MAEKVILISYHQSLHLWKQCSHFHLCERVEIYETFEFTGYGDATSLSQ